MSEKSTVMFDRLTALLRETLQPGELEESLYWVSIRGDDDESVSPILEWAERYRPTCANELAQVMFSLGKPGAWSMPKRGIVQDELFGFYETQESLVDLFKRVVPQCQLDAVNALVIKYGRVLDISPCYRAEGCVWIKLEDPHHRVITEIIDSDGNVMPDYAVKEFLKGVPPRPPRPPEVPDVRQDDEDEMPF